MLLGADALAEKARRKAEAERRRQREIETEEAERDAAEMEELKHSNPEVSFYLRERRRVCGCNISPSTSSFCSRKTPDGSANHRNTSRNVFSRKECCLSQQGTHRVRGRSVASYSATSSCYTTAPYYISRRTETNEYMLCSPCGCVRSHAAHAGGTKSCFSHSWFLTCYHTSDRS